MSGTGSVFPAFIRAEYQDDANGFPAFQRAADTAFTQVEQRQKRFADNINSAQSVITKALTLPRNQVGALDLNVSGLREAQRMAERAASAARELANATRLAATAAQDDSQSARLQVAAMEAVAREHEQAAVAARSHANAMEQVQTQLDKTAGAATRLTINGRNMSVAMQAGAVSAGQMRMASIGVGQQLQDIAVGFASGQRGATIMAQQLPQLGYALSALEGHVNKTYARLGALGTFLSGPWGVIIPIAAVAAGGLATALGDVDESAKEAAKASEAFRDKLLDIGSFADDTTGRMLKLADATIRAAIAMNQLKQTEAAKHTLDLQQQGISATLAYARTKGQNAGSRGILSPREDPEIGAALRKAGFGSPRVGDPNGKYSGNLFVLEREIQKAAQRRPELKGLADDLSIMAAESIEAAKGMKSLRENMDFLTGKRAIVPGFKPPKLPKASAGGFSSESNVIDFEAKRAALMREYDEQITTDIKKRYELEAESLGKIGEVGDELARRRANVREAELADAERMVQLYSQMLYTVNQVGGATGKAAAAVNGILTGNFSGLGKAGTLLNITGDLVGKDGWKQITDKLDQIFGGASGDGTFGRTMTSVLQSVALGQTASSLVFGSKGSGLGAGIGGAVGKKFGEKVLGPAMTKAFGETIGGFAGPLGSIASGLLGGAIGGLFKKKKYGTVSIGQTGEGSLGITGIQGNSSSRTAAAEKSANALIGSLDAIAEQFGVSIDASKGSVSIGQYKDKWRVRDEAYSGKLNFKGESSIGLHDFGNDAQAAAEYATLNLIKDGVLVGLRKGSQTLLANADELQVGLSKALKFENVFRDLKRIKDPVGAAIDDVNREFKGLIEIFRQAGASAAEMADLEELYGIKRKEAAEQAFESVSSSLKALVNDITVGDSGYSLRTRLANAQSAYDPLRARVKSGDTSAYDAYAEAARQLIDISREYYGSGTEYFKLLDEVRSVSQGQLDTQQARYDRANGGESLTFDTKPIVSASDRMKDELAGIMRTQLQVLIAGNDNSKAIAAAINQLGAQGGPRTATGLAARFNF